MTAEPDRPSPYFTRFPAPLDEIAAYVRAHSRRVDIHGHRCVRCGIRLLLFLVQRLSWKRAYDLGALLGRCMALFRLRRSVAMINLDIVYGDRKTETEKMRIYRASLINFGRLIVNYLRLPYQPPAFWQRHCTWKNEHLFRDAMNRGRGVIVLAGHIGLFDLALGMFGMFGYPAALVGKRIRNPVIDKLVMDTRNAMNAGTIDYRRSIRRILRGIRNGEAIAMALDQNMKKRVGIFLDWFGRPACSVHAPAVVARKTGAPVLAGYCYQKGPDRFELVATDQLDWISCPEAPEKEIRLNAQKHADAIQRIILAHPELWFWIHRRWKTQPEGMANPYKQGRRAEVRSRRSEGGGQRSD